MKIENYDIPFVRAKKYSRYKFIKSEEVATKDKLIHLLKEECSQEESSRQLDFDMYFGRLSIESEIFFEPDENKFLISSFVCAEYKEDGWLSEDYADTIIYEEIDRIEQMISDEFYDDIERKMYDSMMKFAKENNLYWSRLNTEEQFFELTEKSC